MKIDQVPRYFVPTVSWAPGCTHAFVEAHEWIGRVIHKDGSYELLECYRLDQAEEFIAQGLWREVGREEALTGMIGTRASRDVPVTEPPQGW